MINQFKISREKIKIIRIRGERAQKKIEIKLSQLEEKLKVLRKLELEERKEVIDVNKIIEKIIINKKKTQSNDMKKQKKEIIKQPEEEEEEKEIKSNKQKEIEIEIEKNTRNQDSIVESDYQKEETHENNILNQNELEKTIEKFSSNHENREINKENIIPKDNCEKVQTQNTDQIQVEKKIVKPQNKKTEQKNSFLSPFAKKRTIEAGKCHGFNRNNQPCKLKADEKSKDKKWCRFHDPNAKKTLVPSGPSILDLHPLKKQN
ncbi:hypothetical protein M0813_29968 [Anaeramoeba flamelloides]|uniref:Uncharacterized protein n=1 Tax=Anaeramoeba flamelloides TaxID=1746091 RepID=A0ABQ8XNI1_9EUKA|nr:hypothetical protein M0813_29968 [Anaeramoeba flamelloides]